MQRRKQDQFLTHYRDALKECGGNNWRNGDIVDFYKTIQSEIKPVCVVENGLSESNFNAYCNAARIAILFDIPFSLSRRCKMTHLSEVAKMVDADTSDQPNEKKFAEALKAVIETKRKPASIKATRFGESLIGGFPIPTANEPPQQLQYRLAKALLEYAEQDKVRPLLDDVLVHQLLRIANGIVGAHEKAVAKIAAA